MKQQMTCREEKSSSFFLDIFGDDKKENGYNIYIYIYIYIRAYQNSKHL